MRVYRVININVSLQASPPSGGFVLEKKTLPRSTESKY